MRNNPLEVTVHKAIKELTSFHGGFDYDHGLNFHQKMAIAIKIVYNLY